MSANRVIVQGNFGHPEGPHWDGHVTSEPWKESATRSVERARQVIWNRDTKGNRGSHVGADDEPLLCDMQFVNNRFVMHSRTAFEDYADPQLRRPHAGRGGAVPD